MRKYRVHEFVIFDYSEIGEYVDEYHTDRPLRNDELVDLLNNQDDEIRELHERNRRQYERLNVQITEKDKELIELRKEIRMLKILYCKCQDCANADLYVPHYTRYGAYTSPRCKITGKEITPNQSACEDFTRIGRNSR